MDYEERRTQTPWPALSPALGIYTAAMTVALTTKDPAEHAAAARLVNDLGRETVGPRRPRSRHKRAGAGPFGRLIAEVLEERLNP